MTTRSRTELVTFSNSFRIPGLDEQLPAGTYEVEIDEERLGDVSFPAYRRVLTLLHLGSSPLSPGTMRTVSVDQQALDAAIARDRAPDQRFPDPDLDHTGLPMQDNQPMSSPTDSIAIPVAAAATGDDLARYGITHVLVDYYHLGGFRYTSLAEAIAQAQRQQGAGGKGR